MFAAGIKVGMGVGVAGMGVEVFSVAVGSANVGKSEGVGERVVGVGVLARQPETITTQIIIQAIKIRLYFIRG